MSREYFEQYKDEQLIELVRTAMGEGCIKPSHVYDAVDILLDRIAKKPVKRNCDVGTAIQQAARMNAFCSSFGKDNGGAYRCERCPLFHIDNCSLAWGQLDFEETVSKNQEKGKRNGNR